MSECFGIIAVFATPEAIALAGHRMRDLGFRAIDAYTPYPVVGLDAVIGHRRKNLLPAIIFAGAVVGAGCGFFIQYWDEALSYPLNVGGRPYDSWPAFIVGAFEIMLLFAMAAGFFAMLAACRLPLLYHPIFTAAAFGRASCDRFVLCVEASDPNFESGLVRRVLERLGAERIEEVQA